MSILKKHSLNTQLVVAGGVILILMFLLNLNKLKGVLLYPRSSSNNQNVEIPTVTSQQPKISGNRLTSPTISGNGKVWSIEFNKLPNWDFTNYGFETKCSGSETCSYRVEIINKSDPKYKITFLMTATEFAYCLFGSEPNNSKSNNIVRVPKYFTITTGFGIIRIGKSENGHYTVCQNNISWVADKTSDWINETEVGGIDIITPQNIDDAVVDEMLGIIKETKFTLLSD